MSPNDLKAHIFLFYRAVFALFMAFFPGKIFAAFYFDIETHEWMAWPEICQVRFIGSDAGKKSEFAHARTIEEFTTWGNKTGSIWPHLHHACAGMVWLQRAKQLPQGKERDRALQKAISNHTYTLSNGRNDNKWYAWVAISLAEVYREMEDYDTAMDLISTQVEAYPEYDRPYLAWSLVLRDRGEYDEAISVLQTAVEKTGGTSAEVFYFLGLTLTDVKRYQEALEPAQEAYKLGYPLPGLRYRLERAGVWRETVTAVDTAASGK